MKRPGRRFVVTLLGLLALAIAATWAHRQYRRVYPATLEAWAGDVRRAESIPRYRTRTTAYDVALFELPDSRLALCRRRFPFVGTARAARIRIIDDAGRDAIDRARPPEPLTRSVAVLFIAQSIDDGLILPIRPTRVGRIHVLFEVQDQQPRQPTDRATAPWRTVISAPIRVGGESVAGEGEPK